MPGICFPNSRSYRGLGPDFPPLLQRAIQQAVGSSLQGDLPNDKGKRPARSLRLPASSGLLSSFFLKCPEGYSCARVRNVQGTGFVWRNALLARSPCDLRAG